MLIWNLICKHKFEAFQQHMPNWIFEFFSHSGTEAWLGNERKEGVELRWRVQLLGSVWMCKYSRYCFWNDLHPCLHSSTTHISPFFRYEQGSFEEEVMSFINQVWHYWLCEEKQPIFVANQSFTSEFFSWAALGLKIGLWIWNHIWFYQYVYRRMCSPLRGVRLLRKFAFYGSLLRY